MMLLGAASNRGFAQVPVFTQRDAGASRGSRRLKPVITLQPGQAKGIPLVLEPLTLGPDGKPSPTLVSSLLTQGLAAWSYNSTFLPLSPAPAPPATEYSTLSHSPSPAANESPPQWLSKGSLTPSTYFRKVGNTTGILKKGPGICEA